MLSSTNDAKNIEANNRMGKTRDLFKKIRDTRSFSRMVVPGFLLLRELKGFGESS